jgi:hypothetical protein
MKDMTDDKQATHTQDKGEAERLFSSLRGSYIVSQALCIAIEELEKVEPPEMREHSNIADMQLLRDELFSFFARLQHADHEQV